MWKSKFSETQIFGILKDAESGVPVDRPAREARYLPGDVFQVAEQIRRRIGVRCKTGPQVGSREHHAQTNVRRPRARECGDKSCVRRSRPSGHPLGRSHQRAY